MKFVEHRVADTRILRLIGKWLKAGVSEEGKWSETTAGTPQGAVISPLLANVYLHYVFDLWVEAWRRKAASGEMVFVRYADDLVVGFEQREDAERFLREFRKRLANFALELHPEKTRLIESVGSLRSIGYSAARESQRASRSWIHALLCDDIQRPFRCLPQDYTSADAGDASCHQGEAASADA